jgi:hypothetical protein
MYSAAVGPTRTKANATRMSTASASVKPTASRRTFHQGRPSSMSYAWFRASISPITAAELLQSAARRPKVRIPPLLPSEIFRIWSCRIPTMSPGTMPLSAPTMRSTKCSRGKKLANASPTRTAGKRAKKK